MPVLQSCLNAKCAELKEIANFDEDEKLIVAETKYFRKQNDKSHRRKKNGFLNSCA